VVEGIAWLWRRPLFRSVLVWMTLEGAAFSSIGLVILFAAIAEQAPDRLLGPANSAAIQLASVAAPVGPLIAGALLAALGALRTTLVYGVWLLALAVAATAAHGICQAPAPAAASAR
jgi:hypothetical protein